MQNFTKEETLPANDTLVCPKCRSSSVCVTRRRGRMERLLVFLGGNLRRCKVCHVRFVRFPASFAGSGVRIEICPKCSSSRVCHTHCRGTLENILVLLRGKLRRCEVCNARFVRWGTHILRLGTKHH